ncbi:hypothetical protein NBRC116188_05550 [Oceaniserpentilla sp. 4NH20-0058]|uniref:formyl transferase n=1 Tax=Oceaniserpentilla sp. 4NH20-0058 TaxID=3127660 RepID=UPI0031079994
MSNELKVVVLRGSSPRHQYLQHILSLGKSVEILALEPKHLGVDRLTTMLRKSPLTFLSRLTKHLLLKLRQWDKKEQAFFDVPPQHSIQVEGVNSPSVIEHISKYNADLIVAFGVSIIKPEVFKLAKYGALNLHGGISPEYKGGNTIFWPLYNGEPEMTGATLHHIVEKVDSGNILVKYYPQLQTGDGELEASCKTFKGAAAEMLKVVEAVAAQKALPAGVVQTGKSHLYLAKHRTLIKELMGILKISTNMKSVDLPERVERFY